MYNAFAQIRCYIVQLEMNYIITIANQYVTLRSLWSNTTWIQCYIKNSIKMHPFPSHTPWLPFHLKMLFARYQNTELFTTWTYSLQQKKKERPFKNNKHGENTAWRKPCDLVCCFSRALHSLSNMGFEKKNNNNTSTVQNFSCGLIWCQMRLQDCFTM